MGRHKLGDYNKNVRVNVRNQKSAVIGLERGHYLKFAYFRLHIVIACVRIAT